MIELLSYVEWIIAFLAGIGTGIFVYRELTRPIPLNNSTDKTTETYKEKNEMEKI